MPSMSPRQYSEHISAAMAEWRRRTGNGSGYWEQVGGKPLQMRLEDLVVTVPELRLLAELLDPPPAASPAAPDAETAAIVRMGRSSRRNSRLGCEHLS